MKTLTTVCLVFIVFNAPHSLKQIPCWCKILLGNKSDSDSDSDSDEDTHHGIAAVIRQDHNVDRRGVIGYTDSPFLRLILSAETRWRHM